MSTPENDNQQVAPADRRVTGNGAHVTLLPVTRLVSRPSVTIVDGRLATVLELARAAA